MRFFQRFTIARDVCVVRQYVDIVYKIYDCDFMFKSFKDFQNIYNVKKIKYE
jgi:hypothetical protein